MPRPWHLPWRWVPGRGRGWWYGGTRCRPWGLPAELPAPAGAALGPASPRGRAGPPLAGAAPCPRAAAPAPARGHRSVPAAGRARVPAGLSPEARGESTPCPLSPKRLELGLPGCSYGGWSRYFETRLKRAKRGWHLGCFWDGGWKPPLSYVTCALRWIVKCHRIN